MNTLEMINSELVYFRDHIEKRAKSIRHQETSRLLTLIYNAYNSIDTPNNSTLTAITQHENRYCRSDRKYTERHDVFDVFETYFRSHPFASTLDITLPNKTHIVRDVSSEQCVVGVRTKSTATLIFGDGTIRRDEHPLSTARSMWNGRETLVMPVGDELIPLTAIQIHYVTRTATMIGSLASVSTNVYSASELIDVVACSIGPSHSDPYRKYDTESEQQRLNYIARQQIVHAYNVAIS